MNCRFLLCFIITIHLSLNEQDQGICLLLQFSDIYYNPFYDDFINESIKKQIKRSEGYIGFYLFLAYVRHAFLGAFVYLDKNAPQGS
jgi:hypothetical protein